MEGISQVRRWNLPLAPDRPFCLYHYRRDVYRRKPLPDMHYAMHVGVMIEGEMEGRLADHVRIIRGGDAWFTPPWEPHCDRGTGKPIDLVIFVVLLEKLGDIGLSERRDWLLPFLLPPQSRPHRLPARPRRQLLKLAREARALTDEREDGETAEPEAWFKLHEILLHVLRHTPAPVERLAVGRTSALERILPAIALARNPRKADLTLAAAARACGLGRSRFSALFQSAMGVSYGRFAHRAQIAAAADAVRHSQAPLKQIAGDFGYYDESHFCRVFTGHFNRSPGAERDAWQTTPQQDSP